VLFSRPTMSFDSQDGLRHRVAASKPDAHELRTEKSPVTEKEEVVWGKTPGGEGACSLHLHRINFLKRKKKTVFRVPTTHDVVTALLHPAYPKSHIDLLNLGSLALQLVLFAVLRSAPRRIFFFVYFAFWRAAYDAGLGYVLTKQSKRRWIVREVQRRGWLDENRRPDVKNWIRKQLVGKMGKDYSFDARSSP
jgi:phosphatidylethanolamine N-methyltransferase